MDYVRIPEPVKLYMNDDTNKESFTKKLDRTLSFFEFVDVMLTNDGYFNKDAEKVEAAGDIVEIFEGKKPGEIVPFPDALMKHIKSVFGSPQGCFPNALVMKQLRPFVRAFTKPMPETEAKKLLSEAKESSNGKSEEKIEATS